MGRGRSLGPVGLDGAEGSQEAAPVTGGSASGPCGVCFLGADQLFLSISSCPYPCALQPPGLRGLVVGAPSQDWAVCAADDSGLLSPP